MDHPDFLRELEQFRREYRLKHPGQPLEYEPALIDRIVSYILQRRAHGETVASCSLKLGIAVGKLRAWVYSRRRAQPGEPSAPDSHVPPVRSLLPVRVRSQQLLVHDGVPERLYSVRSPAGFEVRDLSLQELILVLRQLL